MVLILHRRTARGIKLIDPDHIELDVIDVVNTSRFYKTILGFEEVFVFNHWAILQTGKQNISVLKTEISKENMVIYFKVISMNEISNIKKKTNCNGK